MTVNVIPKRLQRVWDKWNIRGSVLASLCLQILLIFLAPLRKQARGYIIIPIVWTSYLLADFVAAYAIGLISNNQGDKCDKSNVNDALSAFWAPFLLLHLGGPDSITAFSLEDNELWIRHLFGLIAELIMVVYVFTQAIPFSFWLQTLLVLLAGLIKYAERTRALYLACLGNFKDSLKPKPDAGPNYAQLMGEYSSMLEAGLPVKFITVNESERQGNKENERQANSEVKPLNDIEIVREGFRFYQIFRGLIVDHMFSFQERDESRSFFLGLNAQCAFRVMEVELNFMYDALFTKMATVYKSYLGYIFRFICTALIVATYILFQSHHKPHIHPFDIAITYSLLIGAIILDIVALIKLILSDWTLALLKLKKVLRPIYTIGKYISFRRRWSESMGQHNLISFCLKRRFKLLDEVVEYVGLKEIFEFMMHRDFISVENDLKDFIFNQLKAKADEAKDAISAREIHSSKGHMAVLRYTSRESIVATVGENVEFNESVLKWHIATDILYFESTELKDNKNNRNFSKIVTDCIVKHWKKKNPITDRKEAHDVDHKKLCNQLSDYMLYLLFMQPSLTSAVSGIFQIRFQDTCEEAKEFLRRFKMTPDRSRPSDQTMEKEARAELLKVATPVKPVEIKGDRSKSVLFEACMLAKDLKRVDDDKMWKMMSEVLVELLSYGASHCRGNAHAQQLTKGGELVTFVWLLMAHFGLGDQFRIQAGHARAKLITETEREMSEENTEKESAM
ncbi:uncharacterized protein LOC111395704 [Olea europaea var. sylvestris]|uniref:uncharacterized protein LOC111395704 n=1 Tax=Olea europaea var. sylvestris TaxID=158386 RepID=UPI000C1D3546|nr:uncharacterized protein LOC111395704 [Olea europaea var. sylvestris]